MEEIKPFHQRMAELWTISRGRKLTESEARELDMCLEANASHVWRRIRLENLSLIASLVNDTDWQHDICGDMEDAQ